MLSGVEQKASNFWANMVARLLRFLYHVLFSSLLRRIVVVNLAALIFLVGEIMFLSQFREGLVEAKLQSLYTQGKIIAGTIAASSRLDASQPSYDKEHQEDTFFFPLNPEHMIRLLRHIISPHSTFIRIFDVHGSLRLDSRFLYEHRDNMVQNIEAKNEPKTVLNRLMDKFYSIVYWLFMPHRSCDYAYPEIFDLSPLPSKLLQEIKSNKKVKAIRYCNSSGNSDFGIVLPIEKQDHLLGILVISTVDSNIEATVFHERLTIFRMAFIVAVVLVFLSTFLSYTIAGPLRRLSEAADNASKRLNKRVMLPDFSYRADEIGLLSTSFRGLTEAFYQRLEAIERFAADVSHELKNPLTSLTSAVETLALAKTEEQKEKLCSIIKHDVKRLDRLITDIAAASRVDGELAREVTEFLDISIFLKSHCDYFLQMHQAKKHFVLDLKIQEEKNENAYIVAANDLRLGQVFGNLLSNAHSFIPKEQGRIDIELYRKEKLIFIIIEDNGPGINAEDIDKIFERFYTDRPDSENFGQNSGLGLSISRQIIMNYGGSLIAENIIAKTDPSTVIGARFIITLPAIYLI